MVFIRKVKTGSGATAVQIAYKNHGKVSKIVHIGSAHTKDALKSLMVLARQQMVGVQTSLFKEADHSLRIGLKNSYSTLLLQVLKGQYEKLGVNLAHIPAHFFALSILGVDSG